jgi:hypothetical protein
LSGSMSGERKRSVAAWPKLPRLSSTLLLVRSISVRHLRHGNPILMSSGPRLRKSSWALTDTVAVLNINFDLATLLNLRKNARRTSKIDGARQRKIAK